MICLPSYIDPECWSAFLESRKAHKAPFTPQAQKLMVRRLIRAHDQGWDVNEALADAAINGWKSIYPKERRVTDVKDPELAKIERDAKMAAPMPKEVRDKIKSMFRIRANQNAQSIAGDGE